MNYIYRGYDGSGAKLKGNVEAEDKTQAIELLEAQDITVIELKEERKGITLFGGSKVGLSELEFMTSELSLLLASGVKIDKSLEIIKNSKSEPQLVRLIEKILSAIKSGEKLSEAFKKSSPIFDDLYCNLIQLGEESGMLSAVFKDLADDLKFKKQLKDKIISSLTYPAVIFAVCILSVFFIFNFIIPKMAVMFEGMKELPWYTSLMLDASQWMQNYQFYLIGGVLLSAYGIVNFTKKNNAFKSWLNLKSLRIPVLSHFILLVERIRFNSALTMMIKSGVVVDKAIGFAQKNLRNIELANQIEVARKKVNEGEKLSSSLNQTDLYPAFFVSLLEVGEESNNLELIFNEIADRSKSEFESWTQKLTSLLEPIMILIMGLLVGGVVVVMLLSMVSMNDIGI
ncbi:MULTISPECIES: type II secretion system F family protein [Pseudoalteromonas]|uniref:Type II secretion system F family protein n=2 Tax=Pseudoalteromonas TaxID=53246 RepID=A0A8I2HB42_9GAMM|nr:MULTISPECIES: type II secretion system F family protein [Pseudoalteromonas]KID36122.1 secretion system protein [Pseudoalteromonas flavipulchra NCIMB 2033 = ATCC BAA-314]KJY90433.1 secretion system protein [Pseudoalteromonas piscicida]MBD0780291.1 type II secretion system F family protein [Pseudoalteromonas flavipulchra]MBE0371543.1 general secretion pathway protein F [Pseudoalteromonas flavipulchra NCIMB 2033 = ATCC BAA-314]MDP4488945.1 type II secretion system F family protein [Pseudoalter